jgi:hypothetical protein
MVLLTNAVNHPYAVYMTLDRLSSRRCAPQVHPGGRIHGLIYGRGKAKPPNRSPRSAVPGTPALFWVNSWLPARPGLIHRPRTPGLSPRPGWLSSGA